MTARVNPLRHLAKFANICHGSSLEFHGMATMNVSLPEALKDWVEAQARRGRYSNASDYIRDLLRRDQERALKIAELQAVVSEEIKSGVSDKSKGDILVAVRAARAAK
jgi:antitoxin ParD1/3/4